ncbi:MAG: hypothetical protein Kow00121_53420 [Elainellaceae cyanobacterium]
MGQFAQPTQLPPRVPPDTEGISRAVCLLGNRIASDLKERSKTELISLVGAYPTLEQAKYWKHALKQLLKDESDSPSSPEPPAKAVPKARKSARKALDDRPKKSRRGKVRSKKPRQQETDREPARDYSFLGVSNLASIDLSLLDDGDDGWEF